MRILSVEPEPIEELSMVVSTPGGPGVRGWPLRKVLVDELPPELDALIVTSDLQGRAAFDRSDVLGGIAIAEQLETLAEAGVTPPREQTGVVLCGDLYAHPPGDRLGGFGDVRDVWHAFADRFRWVVGVAGNHDGFGSSGRSFAQGSNWVVLDLEGSDHVVELDGLRIAGISGVVGRPTKPMRRSADDFARAVHEAAACQPDLLISHQHPSDLGTRHEGDPALRATLDRFSGVAAFGHKPTAEPLYRLGSCDCLATDGRAFLLVRDE